MREPSFQEGLELLWSRTLQLPLAFHKPVIYVMIQAVDFYLSFLSIHAENASQETVLGGTICPLPAETTTRIDRNMHAIALTYI